MWSEVKFFAFEFNRERHVQEIKPATTKSFCVAFRKFLSVQKGLLKVLVDVDQPPAL